SRVTQVSCPSSLRKSKQSPPLSLITKTVSSPDQTPKFARNLSGRSVAPARAFEALGDHSKILSKSRLEPYHLPNPNGSDNCMTLKSGSTAPHTGHAAPGTSLSSTARQARHSPIGRGGPSGPGTSSIRPAPGT